MLQRITQMLNEIDQMTAKSRSWMRLQELWLQLRIHSDGFRAKPGKYLAAIWWRLLRKKVRARSLVEPLIGKSPSAYALWQQRDDQGPAKARPSPISGNLPIVAIDLADGAEGLDDTLASLAQAEVPFRTLYLGRGGALPEDLPRTPFWLCMTRSGDRLATGALAVYAAEAAKIQDGLIYADDDLVDRTGRRHSPHFKPDWNPELFQWHDFISHACCMKIHDRAELADLMAHGGAANQISGYLAKAGSQHVVHIAKILHHRQQRPEPLAPSPSPPTGLNVTTPPITAIVPTRNQVALLRNCIDGILASNYPALNLIVVDNDSDDPDTLTYLQKLKEHDCQVLSFKGPFNYAAINNFAARHAAGDLLCFLNNDVEMLDDRWIDHMAAQATRPEVGAVGAKLLYSDGTIQHAGVVLGVGGGAAHAHRYLHPADAGYFSRHNLPQFVSAVTAACLMVSRDKFMAVGGFDQNEFPVAFNDVDLCLKLNARGWQSLYEPRATLIHHESKSRGKDSHRRNRDRFAKELAALKSIWNTETIVDPYHNVHLSRYSEQFVVRL